MFLNSKDTDGRQSQGTEDRIIAMKLANVVGLSLLVLRVRINLLRPVTRDDFKKELKRSSKSYIPL